MKHSEYVEHEIQVKGQLARADRRTYLIRETLSWAGIMALVFTIADATPWPLGHERPIARLFIILGSSLAMTWVELSRLRRTRAGSTDRADSP